MTPEELEKQAAVTENNAQVQLVLTVANFQREMGKAEGYRELAAQERARVAKTMKAAAEVKPPDGVAGVPVEDGKA